LSHSQASGGRPLSSASSTSPARSRCRFCRLAVPYSSSSQPGTARASHVDAYVDFSRLASGAVKIDDKRKRVDIQLPKPVLDKPNDPDHSYAFSQRRGLLNRIANLLSAPWSSTSSTRWPSSGSPMPRSPAASSSAPPPTPAPCSGLISSLGYLVTFGSPAPG